MADGCLFYYITDRTQFPGDEGARRSLLLAKISEAVSAGVDYIQLREKDLTTRELQGLASEAVRVMRESTELRIGNREPRTKLLINSRLDIALAVVADGVHLRSDDVAPSQARLVWSEAIPRGLQRSARSPIITVSCHTPTEVVQAEAEGADFAVFAPVFKKKGSFATGLGGLREACQAKIPVVALGGVTVENAGACLEAGAAGIAGIRLFQENSIETVVRTLRASGAENNLG